MQAQYVGVDTGRTLGQCSNLSAVTWGQGAAIGGHPYRSVLQQHAVVHCSHSQGFGMMNLWLHQIVHNGLCILSA